MSEVCLSCQQRAHGKARGAYQFRCPECCAALIRSARPVRRLQEGHIAALQRFHKLAWPAMWEQALSTSGRFVSRKQARQMLAFEP